MGFTTPTRRTKIPILITRIGNTITASSASGVLMRSHECRNVKSAIDLGIKLVGDHAFTAHWARNVEPKAYALSPKSL